MGRNDVHLPESDATCLKMGQEIYFLEWQDLILGFPGLQGWALGMSSGSFHLLIFVTR